MTQRAGLTLPVRLLPGKGGLAIHLLPYAAFAGIALYWMAKHAGYLDANPPPTLEAAFKRIGTVSFLFLALFASVGIKGLVTTILKILPGGPFYHLEISAKGLVIRNLFRKEIFAWRDLPAFETLRVETEGKKGRVEISYYTVAMESLPPPSDLKAGQSYQREVLRIHAEDYGAKDDEQDAAELAAWLNDLRRLALDDKLATAHAISVPGGFSRSVVGA